MKKQNNKHLLILPVIASLTLTACGGMGERISNIGKPPSMSAVGNAMSPSDSVRPVQLPMPTQEIAVASPNSLWQASRQTFFKDQRAHKVGDILTIMVDIDDEADLENTTERTRTGGEAAGLSNLMGLEGYLGKVFPGGVDPTQLVDASSNSTNTGEGAIERDEEIKLKLAAMITQVLPNGNFVIRGSQEVRVNNEVRELQLDGIIRPEDILNNNSISHEKIAEARVSYGGRGTLSDVQQARYGQQFYDIVFPF